MRHLQPPSNLNLLQKEQLKVATQMLLLPMLLLQMLQLQQMLLLQVLLLQMLLLRINRPKIRVELEIKERKAWKGKIQTKAIDLNKNLKIFRSYRIFSFPGNSSTISAH